MSLFCQRVTAIPRYWELEKQMLFKAVPGQTSVWGEGLVLKGASKKSLKEKHRSVVQPCTRQGRPTTAASSWAWWALEGGEHRYVLGWFCVGGAGRSLPEGLSPLHTVRMGPLPLFSCPSAPGGLRLLLCGLHGPRPSPPFLAALSHLLLVCQENDALPSAFLFPVTGFLFVPCL